MSYDAPVTHERIDWVNTLFMIATPIVGVTGLVLLYATGRGVHWATWLLALVLAYATGIAITAGYHRLYSHRTYRAAWPVRLLFLVFGAGTFENSCRKWCSDHRAHHQHVDHERDPYNIRRGFWHAHIGWILKEQIPVARYDNVRDLERDPLVRWQARWYLPLAVLAGFGLPMGLAAQWGDPWGGLLVAGVLRVVVNHHFTFFINSLCHFVGTRPYSDEDSSRDNWLMALFTYGEGYHNFHHAFPIDYRNGIRAHHWDPTKWLIRGLAWCGLAWDLRLVPEERILQARLRMQEMRLLARLDQRAARQQIQAEYVAAARQKVEATHARLRALREEYRALKRTKLDQMHQQLALCRAEVRRARLAFKESLAAWTVVQLRVECIGG